MTLFPTLLRRFAALLAALPLAVLLLAGGQAAAWAEAVPYGKGILWRVQAKDAPAGTAPSHLFGTMHITDERVVTLPEPVRAAFEASRSATFEIVMSAEVRMAMSAAMILTDGRTLDTLLAPEAFSAVSRAAQGYGLQPAQIRLFKPWVLATMLSLPKAELARNAGGSLPLDYALQTAAQRQGKPVHALETPQEQIALFNDMPEETQVAMLVSAVSKNDRIDEIFEHMVRQYLDRDVGAIYASLQDQQKAEPELMELFLRRFNDERNVTMAARMAERLREGGAFIAVGALHLPGEGGLLSLLSQRGYRVERVY